MSQRQRISIIGVGVIMGLVLGLIFKDMYKCLITGIIVSSAITVMLSQQAKKTTRD
ncbi:hypothetical protein RCG19_13540 [Neobacillus sp. OS1-2]|uniref:hypothetical protein n=1 Tax=Neobacillus sp. OS1-2 TaxID=3070680 RepID=UPI0027E04E16|nr:hypothetical protein [Neobacillus sp. OS1-2]WML38246.1 hypothetical protein RCG19_13540 [Neobacillus sp. OS1-2]